MTHECTLKEAFFIKKLDEYQPNWREGEDVTRTTKDKIIEYVENHYSEIFTEKEAACFTVGTISKIVVRIRKKLEITSKRAPQKEIPWQSVNNLNFLDFPKRESDDKICDCADQEKIHEPGPSRIHEMKCQDEPENSPDPEPHIKQVDLVPISCTNPECDKFALITRDDKRYYNVTLPLQKSQFVRPYCSEACQQEHNKVLMQES